MHRYRVLFYQGDALGLKTHVYKGEAWIDEAGLHIDGPDGAKVTVPGVDVQKVEMLRLYGLGRVIRIDHRGGRLFLAVVHFMIGQFALVNFCCTGRLQRTLSDLLPSI